VVGWVLAILLGMAGLLPQSAKTPKTAGFLPSVSISLPPEILSETVQISYFLVGPFGGYGGYAAPRTGVYSYEIPTMVDGKAATEIPFRCFARVQSDRRAMRNLCAPNNFRSAQR
jgi:hypothetical protein